MINVENLERALSVILSNRHKVEIKVSLTRKEEKKEVRNG